MLLTHCQDVFQTQKVDRLGSTFLVENLTKNELWPWGEWRHGKPITTRGIARILGRFGIRPHKTPFNNEYRLAEFADAWQRYLPEPSSTSSIGTNNANDSNVLHQKSNGQASSIRAPSMEHRPRPRSKLKSLKTNNQT
jgi:hypothetical protein